MKSYKDSEEYIRSNRKGDDGKPVWPLTFPDRPSPAPNLTLNGKDAA